jgi:glycosyltransferase involved in cell wall biosynthesis
MKKPKISVVVCTLNEEKYVGACLSRLKKQTIKPEIILVDGHSKDKTVKIAKKYADKILYDHGRGISDARNVGWKAASADVVAYCDCDSKPQLNWTKKILHYIKGRNAVSGPLISYDGTKKLKRDFKLFANLFPRFASKVGYQCIWGANMAFKKKTLRKFPFKLRFLEDFYMSKRLRKTKQNKFISKLTLPVSSRRFKKSFYRDCFKFYIIGGTKIFMGRGKKNKGYY